MNLLDAYALIAYVEGKRPGSIVRDLIEERNCAALTINIAEAYDVLERTYEIDAVKVNRVLKEMLGDVVTIVDLDLKLAARAGQRRATSYHGKRCALSIADCCLLAAANSGDQIVTADPAIIEVARELDIGVIELPRRT